MLCVVFPSTLSLSPWFGGVGNACRDCEVFVFLDRIFLGRKEGESVLFRKGMASGKLGGGGFKGKRLFLTLMMADFCILSRVYLLFYGIFSVAIQDLF